MPQQRSYPGFQGQNLGDVVMALPGEVDAPQGFLDPLMDELPQLLEIFRKVGALFQKRGQKDRPEETVGDVALSQQQ